MGKWTTMVRPLHAGSVIAGLTVVSLLAGCGGGGGGGGSSSGGGTAVLAGPTTINGLSAEVVGNIANSIPELDFLAGAVSSPITVSVSTDPAAPAIPSEYTLESAIYSISPADTTLSNDGLTIKLPYTPAAGTSGLPTDIYYYDVATGTWQPVLDDMGQIDDSSGTSPDYYSAITSDIAPGRGTGGAGPTDYAVLAISPPPHP